MILALWLWPWKQGIVHEMISCGGAPHGFTVFGAKSYREDADQKSWQRGLLQNEMKSFRCHSRESGNPEKKLDSGSRCTCPE